MKNLLAVLFVVLCLFTSACGGNLYSQVRTNSGSLYVGMSGDQATNVMGPPEAVGQGRYGCHFVRYFFGFEPGTRTAEWAWRDPSGSGGVVVAYIDGGVVSYLGLVPKDKLK